MTRGEADQILAASCIKLESHRWTDERVIVLATLVSENWEAIRDATPGLTMRWPPT